MALAVEGLRDARRLFLLGDAARAAGKAVVVLKLGRGEAGAAAAVSHTGSLAGSAAAWSAAFRRAGMAEVEDFDALLETAGLFAKAPRPKARGVAIVTPSGGAGIMAADHAEALGLDMPQPAPETERVLRSAIPDFGAPRNPCDLTAQVATNPAMFDACMDAMLADAQYGVVVMPMVYSHHATTQGRMEGMRPHARKHGKPLCIAWIPEQLEGPGRGGRGWGAGAAAVPQHAAADERHPPLARPRRGGGDAAARRRRRRCRRAPGLDIAVASLPGDGAVLMEAEAKALFARAGLPVVEERRTTTAEAAAEAAAALGFPVVLKLDSPDIAHKTEVGGVRLNLGNEAAVREAFDAIIASARHARAECAGRRRAGAAHGARAAWS